MCTLKLMIWNEMNYNFIEQLVVVVVVVLVVPSSIFCL